MNKTQRTIYKHRVYARLRALRYWFSVKVVPKRLQPNMIPSIEFLERCGKKVDDSTYIYRFCEYYVDKNDNEVMRVTYGRR